MIFSHGQEEFPNMPKRRKSRSQEVPLNAFAMVRNACVDDIKRIAQHPCPIPQVLDVLLVPTDDECETELSYALCESELPLEVEEIPKPLHRLL